MPNISIQPTARSIEEILAGPSYYKIPRFQRPFSWEAQHIEDFWSDAVANMDPGYFIGPMVVFREDARDWGVVDGQQRLTTITLLLAAIRDAFEAIGEESLAEATHRFIERPDPDNKPRFVLQSDVDEGRWIQAIQLPRSRGGKLRKADFDAAAWAAFSIISQNLERRIRDAAGGGIGEDEIDRPAAVLALKAIRDQLLALKVIWVPLDSEDDAYEIFETLNSRGKDLEVSDRLKNYFLGHLRAANANVDDHKRRWNALRDTFAGEPSSRDLDRFVHHWWLSRAPYVAERKVFKEIKRAVPRASVMTTFDEFEADADRYQTAVRPDSTSWTVEKHQVRDSLRALQLMRLAQPMPFVLALLRAYDVDLLSLKKLVEVLRIIENYHFQVTAISTKSSSGGISEMYASHARQIFECTTKEACQLQVKDLGDKLRKRKADRADFMEAFAGRLIFTDEHSRDKRLVQYVLTRLHSYARPSPAADFTKFSIEHILPQAAIASDDDVAVVGSIGNLLFVDDDLNQKLGDKVFTLKTKILGNSETQYELSDVLAAHKWGKDEIDARARRLAETSYDSIWSL